MPFTFLRGRRVYYNESTHIKCRSCYQITKKKQCKYEGHDRKCANCGICMDCVVYEKKLKWYKEIYNDADYYLEYLEDYGVPPQIESPAARILRRRT